MELFRFRPLHFFTWDEEAFYAVRVSDAYLDVCFFVEAGVFVFLFLGNFVFSDVAEFAKFL